VSAPVWCPVCRVLECEERLRALDALTLDAQQKVLAGYDVMRQAVGVVAAVVAHGGEGYSFCRQHGRVAEVDALAFYRDVKKAAVQERERVEQLSLYEGDRQCKV
jgi:hypothetical protein